MDNNKKSLANLTDKGIRSKITRLFKSRDQPTRMEIASLSEEVTSRLDVTKKESERVKWDNYLELLIIMSNSLALVEKAKALDISSDSESEEDDDQSKSSRSSRTKDKKRSSRRKHKVSTSNDNNDSSDSSESDSDTDDESIDELRLKLKLLKAKKSKRNKKNSVSKIDAVDESIPSHQAVKLIDKFKSEVGDWPRFKRSVETIVLNRKDVSDGIKSQMIQGLLTKESLGCWTKNQTNGYSLRKCWKKLSNRYEDSQQINLFLNSKILEMKAIKDQYDYRGLETISRQVEELNNVLNSLGEEKCVGISNHLLWRISDRFWSPENDKMYKKCKTMEQLAKYIADLYDAAVMFAQRNQLPIKSSTTITANKKKVQSIQTSRISSRIESNSSFRKCYLCSEGHFAVDCTAPLSVEEKKRIVREKRLCTNCLRPGHGAARCFKKDRIICASCNGKHPTPLHGITVSGSTEQSNSNDNVVAAVNLVRCPTRKTIGTFHGHLGINKCEIILDSGSVVSIISTKLASCGLHRKVDPILLVGFDSSMEKTDVVADVVVKYPNGGIPVTAYVSSRAPPNQLIIGLDYLSHMFKSGHRIWHTIFGDIDLEELSVIKPVRSVLWHNKEEPLDDCEDGIQLPIERVDSIRYQIKLPFFTDKRPSNNFELLHSWNRLQIRLQKDELVVYEPELMQFVVNKHIGIQWDMRADEFRFDWKFDMEINIKRDLLAYIGKCLDSLGIVDPVKLKFRLLFAKAVKLDSDDSVEQDALDSIGVLASDTNVVRDVHFGRIVHPAADLNWFCDASESGYGCVIYIEYEIVLDKFKLAPKPKTIVELELFVMNEAVVAISKVIDHFKFNGIVRFLSDNLLRQAHHKSKHRGLHMSLAMIPAYLRIVDASRHMRKIISKCILCRMIRAKPFGPLHSNQLTFQLPFEDITTDVFGPLKLRNGSKCYGLIVICRTSKAIKLIVLPSLSGPDLWTGLETVWNQVGWPRRIWSDNGSNYLDVKNKIDRLQKQGEFTPIQWNLSAPFAPWMNGMAERYIRVSKEVLNQCSSKCISLFTLQQRFYAIESIANQRPVLNTSEGPISAFQIITGRKMQAKRTNGTNCPELVVKHRSKFMIEMQRLWISQILTKMTRMSKNDPTEIKQGDWCLSPRMMTSRHLWPLVQIQQPIVGSDGICRTAWIKQDNKILLRPVNGLIPLSGREAVAVPHD
ncbi:H/ACA snoRNP pseudouridylase subunit [Blomia tropicalis]|nr:H/ACA snoRNP pseudouridylase subunit [Blomia tropicalis]